MQHVASQTASLDSVSLGRSVSRGALPIAHEDLAIVFGAYLMANHLAPAGGTIAAIAGAILASDLALYGIGAGARRLPWLQRRAVDERVRAFGDVFRRDLFALIALCRFVPGLILVAGVACGFARVSLVRFTVATICVSASYVVMMLYLVTIFGHAIEGTMGLWTWPLLLALLAAAAFARQRILAFRGTTAAWRGEPIRLR
jgi:membrane protein DedA with SNARE-associated domain